MRALGMDGLLGRILAILGSMSLAFYVLVLLGILTLVGTLDQQHMSLYDVQVKYFESIVLVYWIGDKIPLPLLGGYLLLTILCLNILVGGILRLRKGKATMGILVAHIGIVILLLGSFIEDQFSSKGQMRLFEGQTGNEYTSVYEWEIAVREVDATGRSRESVIPEDHFKHLEGGDTTVYAHENLPFDLVLSGYARNARPRPLRPEEARLGMGADGYVLDVQDEVGPGNTINLPGVTAMLRPKAAGEPVERAILWGGERAPWAVSRADVQYQFTLRRRTWELPFSIRLDRFVHTKHPGMSMAKEYSSYVTKTQGESSRAIHITMNEPLRHEGVTLYQSGWGPQGAAPGTRLWSDFSVVSNPSDQVPKYACYVIALGLLWHFLRRLFLHLKAERRRRESRAAIGESA
jgi:hypothetical protein